MSNFTKSEKRILYTVLLVVIILLIAIVAELYIVYQQLLVSKLLLNANVIQQAIKPEEKKPINFWDLAALLIGIKFVGSKLLTDGLSKLKEFGVSYFNSLPQKLTLINLPVFLRIPGSKFPGKGIIPTKEIQESPQAKFLFECFKIAKDNGIYSGDEGALGYQQQFKSDAFLAKELYLKLINDAFLKFHPEKTTDATLVYKFWEKVLSGSGDSGILFVIQSTFLSIIDKLDETQYTQCFDILFEKLVAEKGKDPTNGIKREVTMFIRACELLTQNTELKHKCEELYKTMEQEDKDQLKPVFKSIFIASINRKRV